MSGQPGLDNLTPEPQYGNRINAADVALDARLDAAEAALATIPDLTTTLLGIGGTSTTSAVAVDMAGSSLTVSCSGRPIFLFAFFNCLASTPAGFVNVQLHLDGVNQFNMLFDDLTTARDSRFAGTLNTPSAGSHTFKVQWHSTGGATVGHAGGYLAVLEL